MAPVVTLAAATISARLASANPFRANTFRASRTISARVASALASRRFADFDDTTQLCHIICLCQRSYVCAARRNGLLPGIGFKRCPGQAPGPNDRAAPPGDSALTNPDPPFANRRRVVALGLVLLARPLAAAAAAAPCRPPRVLF